MSSLDLSMQLAAANSLAHLPNLSDRGQGGGLRPPMSSLDLTSSTILSNSSTSSVVLSPPSSIIAPAPTPASPSVPTASTPSEFSLDPASSLSIPPAHRPASQALRWSLSHVEMADAVGEQYKPLCKEGETILTNFYGNDETGFLYGLTYLKKENGVFMKYQLFDIYACDLPVVFHYGFLPATWYRKSRRVDARVPTVLGPRSVDSAGCVANSAEDDGEINFFETSAYKVPKHVHPSTPSVSAKSCKASKELSE